MEQSSAFKERYLGRLSENYSSVKPHPKSCVKNRAKVGIRNGIIPRNIFKNGEREPA